jgi:hypothetical protein
MFDGKVKLNGTVSANQQSLFSGADGSSFNTGVYRNALNYNPTDQPKDANGNWIEHVDRTDYANPVALLRETIGKIQNTNLRTYGTISYFPIDDLQIMLLGSRDLNNACGDTTKPGSIILPAGMAATATLRGALPGKWKTWWN